MLEMGRGVVNCMTIQLPNGARNGIVNFVIANANVDSGGHGGSGKGFDGQGTFN